MNSERCFTPKTVSKIHTSKGPLTGLTFALKDLCDIQGLVTSFGHEQWRKTHKAAQADSQILQTLLASGADLKAIAKLDQLAFSLIGNVSEGESPTNTLYPERYCGGSSSGSASAVAAGLVDFSVGSDTAGSVRVPAAACGVFGIRTTHGSVRKDGVIPLSESCDVLGFFARDPDTLAKATKVALSIPTKPHSFTQLLIPDNLHEITSQEYAEVTRKEAEDLASRHSLVIKEIDFSTFVSEDARMLLVRNQSREIWDNHSAWAEANHQHLDPDVATRLLGCKQPANDNAETIEADIQSRHAYTHKLEEIIGTNSILCLPVLPESGPNKSWDQEKLTSFRGATFRLSAPSSLSGLPQLSVPISHSSTNIGIIGPKNSDLSLLSLY